MKGRTSTQSTCTEPTSSRRNSPPRQMVANGKGHIIDVTASIAMQPNGRVPSVIPTLFKGGINAATRALALELAASKVRVNAIAAGLIDTPLHELGASSHAGCSRRRVRRAKRKGWSTRCASSSIQVVTGVAEPVDGGSTSGRW